MFCSLLVAEKGVKLCELDSYSCVSDVYGMRIIDSIDHQILNNKFLLNSEDVRQHEDTLCHCLPPCTDIWYDPEISYATFPGRGFNLTRTFKRMVAARNLSVESSTDYFKYVIIYSISEVENL